MSMSASREWSIMQKFDYTTTHTALLLVDVMPLRSHRVEHTSHAHPHRSVVFSIANPAKSARRVDSGGGHRCGVVTRSV